MELQESKSILETKLDKPVHAICYPQGSYDDRVTRLAKVCGYDLGFTTRHGICEYPMEDAKRFTIPRVGVWSGDASEWHWSLGRLVLQ